MKLKDVGEAQMIREKQQSRAYKVISEAADKIAPPRADDGKPAVCIAVFYDRERDMLAGHQTFEGPVGLLLESAKAFVFMVNSLLQGVRPAAKISLHVEGFDEKAIK